MADHWPTAMVGIAHGFAIVHPAVACAAADSCRKDKAI